MTRDVYRELANKLDAIAKTAAVTRHPHVGFPATESGVELRLLAKIFTPDEAKLAAVMQVDREPASDIAARAAVDAGAAYSNLRSMARKVLIGAARGKGELVFGLIPWAVGLYEGQLPRMDAELAGLFEEYLQETRATNFASGVPIHRVIPVEEAIDFDLDILPYERASELLSGAKAWGVRNCICRSQQRLIGKGCERPIENCMVFAPVEGAFDHSQVDRAIALDEALRILREAEEASLVHSTGNTRKGNDYICNCCTCCCAVLRGVAEFSMPTAIASSGYQAAVDADLCASCGDCVERCQFDALSLPHEICMVNASRCVGCGLCTTICPTGALHLERRPADDIPSTPVDMKEWAARSAEKQGLSVRNVS